MPPARSSPATLPRHADPPPPRPPGRAPGQRPAPGLLRLRRRELPGRPSLESACDHRRPRAVPVHVQQHGHVGHPRARGPEPVELVPGHRRLPQPQLREAGRRQLQLQPRAPLAEVVRLPRQRRAELPLRRLPHAPHLRRRVQLVQEQQALRGLHQRMQRADDRSEQRHRRWLGDLPRQLQLDRGIVHERHLPGEPDAEGGRRTRHVLRRDSLRRWHARISRDLRA